MLKDKTYLIIYHFEIVMSNELLVSRNIQHPKEFCHVFPTNNHFYGEKDNLKIDTIP